MGSSRPRECIAGVDVSAKKLDVAMEGRDVATFENTQAGFKKLATYLTKRSRHARVVLEATGNYHVDLAWFLAHHARCSVMVVNPRDARHFHLAQGIRAKTDKVDAVSLLQFGLRMPFQEWQCPTKAVMELRAVARYVDQLVKSETRLKNQLHAAEVTSGIPSWLREQLQEQLAEFANHIELGEAKLIEMAKADPEIQRSVELLDSVPGIAPATAVRMVAEFMSVQADMSSKEITAWAGLDPRPRDSGTSVRGRRGMSKRGNARVRRLLYMPALAAARKAGPLQDLVERVAARSGKRMIGIGALMRKLLVVCWAIYRTRKPWDLKLVRPRQPEAVAA